MAKPLTKRQKEKIARDALALAVEAAGSFAALGRVCGVSREAVRRWQALPAQFAIAVSDKFRIPRSELAPDIYPDDPPKTITRLINGEKVKAGSSANG